MDSRIASISTWEIFKIYSLSFLCGIWVYLKKTVAGLIKTDSNFKNFRDKPPSCLVDSTLGIHNYIKVRGTKFHYVELGSSQSPFLLLLHGFPDCWLSWRNQIPELSKYFRVVAVDLKGFGDSDKPVKSKSYSIDVILEELKELITSFGQSKCTVMAHDLGALLTWHFVHKYPDMVDKLILISAPHPNLYWDNLSSQSNLNLNWLCFLQIPQLPEADALKDDLKIINNWHSHLQEKDVFLEAYKYTFSRPEDWIGPFNYFRNLPFIRICDISRQIGNTTLLVVGGKDQVVSLENIVKSSEFCEKFVVKIVDGCGHFPHQENPQAFNNAIVNFLKVKLPVEKNLERSQSKGLVNKMFGAVSSTVKYGNSVIDSVQKRTNGVVGNIPTLAFSLTQFPGVNTKSDIS